ncbi:MAG: orotidine-5'-phosphate decarboxylase [Bacteroidota bacterium]|nr:orotidine-5'-phosphate decarboxylase [Bacteroidota bacterium]
MNSKEKLERRLNLGLHICVGLDTDFNKIPKHLLECEDPIFEFNRRIIEATKVSAAAYKLNLAFYEKEGAKGFTSLLKTLEIIPAEILTIGDAKRGDIGNTSAMYAAALFDHLNFDSCTLNPYMGVDSMQPFLSYKDKLHFILALTSNSGSQDFEKLILKDGKFLYEEVIEKINSWNQFQNCGVVFGANNPNELERSVSKMKDLFVLLPGVGTQGGSLEEIVKIFAKEGSNKFLVNISRAIIYAGSGESFESAVSAKLSEYNLVVENNL